MSAEFRNKVISSVIPVLSLGFRGGEWIILSSYCI